MGAILPIEAVSDDIRPKVGTKWPKMAGFRGIPNNWPFRPDIDPWVCIHKRSYANLAKIS